MCACMPVCVNAIHCMDGRGMKEIKRGVSLNEANQNAIYFNCRMVFTAEHKRMRTDSNKLNEKYGALEEDIRKNGIDSKTVPTCNIVRTVIVCMLHSNASDAQNNIRN